ncbi:MAG: glycosyltransferase family 39 protein [Candidatus Shapirobacteria bacterium]|nr:glycosyltransferase family 39 protein [Candidatus Shapirobacteria bacterium]
MKNKILNILKILLFISILVLALIVRKRNYAEIPIPGQSVDEYSYSWVGLSLIENGMPTGVSGIDGYQNSWPRYINVDRFFQTVSTGDPLTINYPWMDHPPLLGLITGGYAYLSGVRVFEDTVTSIIRKPIIVISTISVALLMIYCWINFNFLTMIIGGLTYATIPLVVLSGRMIQAENAIIPCLLACMICISLYLKKKKDYWLLGSALIAGIATLFKLSGVVCHLFVLLVLLNNYKSFKGKFIKDFGFFLIVSLPISFLFVIYGSVYGIENFKNILFSNYNRFYGIGPNSLIELIRNQRLTQHKFLPEVSIISGWLIFLGWIINKPKKLGTKLVILSIFSYLIIYIFFGSQPYGWYAFPFWPLLIIVLSKFLSDGIKQSKNLIAVFFVALLILGANIARIIDIFQFQPLANWWRIGVSLGFFVLILMSFFKFRKNLFFRLLLVVIIILIIYTNLKYLNSITLDFWWQNIS